MSVIFCRCGAPLGLQPGRAGAISVGRVDGEELCVRCGAVDEPDAAVSDTRKGQRGTPESGVTYNRNLAPGLTGTQSAPKRGRR